MSSLRGCKNLSCLNGSGRKKNKILCLPLVISKLSCLPDDLEELNYYNEYHFENGFLWGRVSKGIKLNPEFC